MHCGDNKKQTNFQLGLLLFLNSPQTLNPFDTWADAPPLRLPPTHPSWGAGGGEGGKYVTSAVPVKVDGCIVVSTDSREKKTLESPIADEPRMERNSLKETHRAD